MNIKIKIELDSKKNKHSNFISVWDNPVFTHIFHTLCESLGFDAGSAISDCHVEHNTVNAILMDTFINTIAIK